MGAEFDEVITDRARLREIIGEPSHRILGKVIDHIDDICAKYIARAGLWRPEKWPDISDVPSLAEGMVAHGKLAESVGEMQDIIDTDYKTRMY